MDPTHPDTNEDLLDSAPPKSHGPEPVPSGPTSSTRPTGYSAVIELMGFEKGTKEK